VDEIESVKFLSARETTVPPLVGPVFGQSSRQCISVTLKTGVICETGVESQHEILLCDQTLSIEIHFQMQQGLPLPCGLFQTLWVMQDDTDCLEHVSHNLLRQKDAYNSTYYQTVGCELE